MRRDERKKSARDFVSAELRAYHETKKDLAELKADIALEGPKIGQGERRGPNLSNPTERKTERILTNKRIRRMEDTLRAIDVVLGELPGIKQEFVRLKYWDRRLTVWGIALELQVGESTARRWNGEILDSIAVEMGLLNAN